MNQVITCPSQEEPKYKSIFLAGSIEMNTSKDWQIDVQKYFENDFVTLYNPRRKDWDSGWTQSLDNPVFVEQVEWELEKLESCDFILMHFEANTKSPISLLEFGLYARRNPLLTPKMIVSCSEGFWRSSNVHITAKKYRIPVYFNLGSAIEHLRKYI